MSGTKAPWPVKQKPNGKGTTMTFLGHPVHRFSQNHLPHSLQTYQEYSVLPSTVSNTHGDHIFKNRNWTCMGGYMYSEH